MGFERLESGWYLLLLSKKTPPGSRYGAPEGVLDGIIE